MARGAGVSAAMRTRYDLLREEQIAAKEGRRRRRSVAILGAVLVLSFLLPVGATGPRGAKLEFLSFTMLVEDGVPGVVRYLLLHPLLAGMLCVGMIWPVPERVRGALLVVAGLVPLAVAAARADVLEVLTFAIRSEGGPAVIAQLMACVGIMAIFAGARARWYRPLNLAAYAVGLGGCITYVISLAIPGLPEEMGRVRFLAVFHLFGERATAWLAFTNVVDMLTTIAAGTILATALPRLHTRQARQRARLAFWLLVGGLVLDFIGVTTTTVYILGQMGGAGIIVSSILKFGTMIIAMSLLLPFGLIDLVIGPAPQPVRPAEAPQPIPARATASSAVAQSLADLAADGALSPLKPRFVQREGDPGPPAE